MANLKIVKNGVEKIIDERLKEEYIKVGWAVKRENENIKQNYIYENNKK